MITHEYTLYTTSHPMHTYMVFWYPIPIPNHTKKKKPPIQYTTSQYFPPLKKIKPKTKNQTRSTVLQRWKKKKKFNRKTLLETYPSLRGCLRDLYDVSVSRQNRGLIGRRSGPRGGRSLRYLCCSRKSQRSQGVRRMLFSGICFFSLLLPWTAGVGGDVN